ncbi:MAG TPA: DUF3817 domain-containing protein [Cyclobacteriaceae bacterium]|nr:DUF3817 domain-containing protein [Cyclobacteriaceae bacterium]HMV11293.1 DUF3817 domain-containing protein [Cyclobacteriaceae bacterium]HMV91104.1 DUF3817 domain-containing protein [Cyclobacteriaceae bacterium]HMX01643.1 DUF3817 domain-containing protein [Cyclobacteriaceae bacterium]HMX50663.1 DUF3817 domain-containing protein [Cyclobacteriaceae bacterium]
MKSIRNLRIIGILEGVSFLVLGAAMVVKYGYGIPEAVKYPGWAHGLLFVLYIIAVPLAQKAMNWNFKWLVIAWAASVIPLGTFFLDKYLVKREKELLAEQTA